MNPLFAMRCPTLNPLNRTVSFFLLHTNVAMIVRFNLFAALATVKLTAYEQVLVIFEFVRAHLTLEAELTDILARLPYPDLPLVQSLKPAALVMRVRCTGTAVEVLVAHSLEADGAELALLADPEVNIIVAFLPKY